MEHADGRMLSLVRLERHGHTLMNDLADSATITAGYSGIGGMRGLAEIRGLMLGLRHQTT